jgi:hypothetical protein
MAEALADPTSYINLFPDFQLGLQAEAGLVDWRQKGYPSSEAYSSYEAFDRVDIVQGITIHFF